MSIKKSICRLVIFASMAFFLAFQSVSAAGAKTVKVFLLGGQSNMAGYGRGVPAELKTVYQDTPSNLKIWNVGTRQWGPLANGSFGPELSFGHAIAKAFPNDEIRLVKYAVNGTSLYNGWAPTKGPQYVVFMDTVTGALADLNSSKVEYKIAGMLWLQGESDAGENKGEEYEKNLSAFIKHMRTQFKEPEMPFIIARVRDFYGKGAQAKLVRDAQEKVAKTTKNVAWFDTDDCGDLIKGGHYASAGLITIGNRFAQTYRELKK